MQNKIEELMTNPVFLALTEEKRNAIISFARKSADKNIGALLPDLLQLNVTLNKGKPLTLSEQTAIQNVILSSLSPDEQNKFMSILNVMKGLQ